jgi:hypothetical protein
VPERRSRAQVLIVSAGVADVIEEFLRLHDVSAENITVCSNRLNYGADVAPKSVDPTPPITSFTKAPAPPPARTHRPATPRPPPATPTPAPRHATRGRRRRRTLRAPPSSASTPRAIR